MVSSIVQKFRSVGSSLAQNYTSTSRRANEFVEQSLRYHFRSRWSLDGSIDHVAGVLMDSSSLPHWWPQFLGAEILEPGDPRALGRVFRVVTKGWLPYKLRFQLQVMEVNYPYSFRVESTGDFHGVGIGRLRQHLGIVIVEWDWQVTVRKPLLKLGSPLMKRLFETNHYWLMRRGERHLQHLLVS